MKMYELPNGRLYRIVFHKNYHEHIKEPYIIESLLMPKEVKKLDGNPDDFFKKHFPEGRWQFIQECETEQDALETICLFARTRNVNDLKKYEL